MNSKTKTREGIPHMTIDQTNDKSRLTQSYKEKADVLGKLFSSVFTLPGDVPTLPAYQLQFEMLPMRIIEELLTLSLKG